MKCVRRRQEFCRNISSDEIFLKQFQRLRWSGNRCHPWTVDRGNRSAALDPQRISEFLDPLPVGRIWGVGAKAEQRLHELGFRSIGQLAAAPEHILMDHFGGSGRTFHELALGIDDRAVVPDWGAKSISSEWVQTHPGRLISGAAQVLASTYLPPSGSG